MNDVGFDWVRAKTLVALGVVLFVLGTAKKGYAQIFQLIEEGEKLELPFEYQQDFILVEMSLHGKIPMKFIFDTGAENTVIFDQMYLDIFSVEYDMKIPIIGSNLSTQSYAFVARDIPFEINRKLRTQLDVLVLENYGGQLKELLGTQVNGILGSSFFRHFIVEIDYRRKKIILSKDREDLRRKVLDYESLPLQIINAKPYVLASISMAEITEKELLLLIDTGAGIHLLVHSNTDPSLRLPDQVLPGYLGVGIGGLISGYIGRSNSFELGENTYIDMLVNFQNIDSALLDQERIIRNGIIGNPFLNRYCIIIDYSNEQLYLKARKKHLRPFKFDRSGLTLIASGPELNQYYIQSVRENSPAEAAGAQPGDRIRWAQRWPARFWSLEGLVKLLKKREGKTIRLSVQRGDEKVRLKFELKKLI
jgi:hypothetical protein